APPAVRILVFERFPMPETPACAQRLFDLRVGVEDPHAAEQLNAVEKVSGRSDWRVHLEAVLLARPEIVGPVSRSRMHDAGAGLERHVVREDTERLAVVERMLESNAFEQVTLHRRDRRPEIATDGRTDGGSTRLGDDHRAAVDQIRAV